MKVSLLLPLSKICALIINVRDKRVFTNSSSVQALVSKIGTWPLATALF